MKWFKGSIAEAVAVSQAKSSLFCVVILGSDPVSEVLLNSLESAEVQTIINKEDIVCIRIASDSQDFHHFTGLYANAKSPSIYCLTKGGKAVEVISTEQDSANLKLKFQSALILHKSISSGAMSAILAGSQQNTTTVPSAPLPGTSTSAPIPTVSPVSSTETPVTANTSSTQESSAPLESRIERAKLLARAKQQKKEEDEKEEEKRREIERRQVGQKVAEMKRRQDEEEIKKLAEERRKDKEQEAQLRQRLRDQIAQDRIDRQARQNMAAGVDAGGSSFVDRVPAKSNAPSSVNYAGQARLQFRLPDGSSQNHSFAPDSTLGEVRQYLLGVVPFRDFSIWVAFPRREFTSSDYSTTLRDLGLLPSSALLIIPITSTSIVQNAGQAGQGLIRFITMFLGYAIYPITFILTLLQRALPIPQTNPNPNSEANTRSSEENRSRNPRNLGEKSGNTPSGSSTKKTETGPSSTSGESRSKPPSAQGKKSTQEKGTTEGNVHRLRTSESDSDDEQATWNGNSTQQM